MSVLVLKKLNNISALFCSILHYALFTQLHGRVEDGSETPMRQSYVTATSIILSMLFRAALLGGVWLSCAQHIWRVLRDRAIPVSVIESLFQLRHNPFELENLYLLRYGLVIYCIAVYMWLVPLAVTFPPGALTISLRPFMFTKLGNVSVLGLPTPSKENPYVLQPVQNFFGSRRRFYRRWLQDSTPTSHRMAIVGGRSMSWNSRGCMS